MNQNDLSGQEIIENALTCYLDANVDYLDAYLVSQVASSDIPTIFTLDKRHFGRLTKNAVYPGPK